MEGKRGKKIVAGISVCFATALLACALASLSGCAPKSASENENANSSSSDAIEVTLTNWTPDTNCAACHTAEADSSSDSSCTASKHAGLQCSDCHTDEAALTKAHKNKSTSDRMPTRLKTTTVSSAVCTKCHNQSDLAAKTASCTALTDQNGTTVNPHSLPATQTHESINCADCHTMHASQTDVDTDAKNYCLTCHHANVFQCYTCHQHS